MCTCAQRQGDWSGVNGSRELVQWARSISIHTEGRWFHHARLPLAAPRAFSFLFRARRPRRRLFTASFVRTPRAPTTETPSFLNTPQLDLMCAGQSAADLSPLIPLMLVLIVRLLLIGGRLLFKTDDFLKIISLFSKRATLSPHVQLKVFVSTLPEAESRVFSTQWGFSTLSLRGGKKEESGAACPPPDPLLASPLRPQVFCSSSMHQARLDILSEVRGDGQETRLFSRLGYLWDVQRDLQLGFIDGYRIISHHVLEPANFRKQNVPGRSSDFMNFPLGSSTWICFLFFLNLITFFFLRQTLFCT